MSDDFDTPHDDLSDLGLEGYESAVGWQSPEETELRKKLAEYRKKKSVHLPRRQHA